MYNTMKVYKNEFKDMNFAYIKPENLDLENVIKYYKEYIQDEDKVNEIFSKIHNLRYVNAGFIDYEEWKHNKHIFIINGETFEYKTGTGIDCNAGMSKNGSKSYPVKKQKFDFTKLLFDAVYCFLQEAYDAETYHEDDFCEEFGYTESVKQYKKGIAVYQEMKINAEKSKRIFGKELIVNLFDIMQL